MNKEQTRKINKVKENKIENVKTRRSINNNEKERKIDKHTELANEQ